MNALLRMLNQLLRSALLVFSMLVVLLALFVSMGRELAPLLAEYRSEVQQQAQAALGMPLRIGRLQGSWRNLGPLLVAHDVQLGEGARSIQLQQLRLAPDLLGSLMQRRLVVERVELEGLKLNLQQIDAGNWRVKGWLPAQTPAAESALPDKSALLLGLSRVLLFNSQITLEPRGMAPVTFTYVNLGWRNSGTRQRLDGQITLPDGQPLSFSLKGRLDLADWQRSPAQLYLSLPQTDWARWMPAGLLPGLRAEVLQVGGEFWFSLAEGVLQRAVARMHAPQLRLGAGQNPTADVQDLAVTAYLDRDAQDYRLRLESLAFSLEQTRWGPAQLLLRQQTGSSAASEQWQLQADHLQLEALAQLALGLAPVPEQAAVWLAGLDPRGQLSSLQVDYRPQQTDAGRLRFAANLESVAISAHLQVPGAEQVSGSIVGDLAGGELRLASEDFVLDLAGIFPVPWRYRSAAAKLWWRVDEQGLSLGSPLIRLDGEEGRIAGDLLIRLPSAEGAKSYMDLRAGLRDGNAAYTEKYLPRPSAGFSAQLRDWLKVAIRAGSIDEGLFVFSGSLEAADSGEHEDILSLFFRLRDMQLDYQPDWPPLHKAVGDVRFDAGGVQVELSQAELLNSRIGPLRASVAAPAAGQAASLQLHSEFKSSLEDALQILQQAPTGARELLAGWSGSGPLLGQLQLDIPLAAQRPPQVQVDFATEAAELRIDQPPLTLTRLDGAFRYNSASGLSSPKFNAHVFGNALRGRVVAEGVRGNSRTRIEASGQVGLPVLLDWLEVDKQDLPISGRLPFQLRLTLDEHDNLLQVDSSLQGLAVDLPPPFGKPAGETRQARLSMPLGGTQQRLNLQYADQASLAFAAPTGELQKGRGELLLGPGKASLPTVAGLHVAGQLDELDLAVWQDFLKLYSVANVLPDSTLLRSASLQIGRFSGLGMQIENLQVALQRQTDAWNLQLASELLEGGISVPDQSDQPLQLKLQHLRLPEPPQTDAEAQARRDVLGAMVPADLPPMDVYIDSVMLGSEALGSWSFKSRPTRSGVLFSELDLNMQGLQIGGEVGWEGRPGNQFSWFKGRMHGADLAEVLEAWNFSASATSKSFSVDADISWPGSPMVAGLAQLSGSLDLGMREGRFLEVSPGAQTLRVFSLVNFAAIGQRLRLDFSDVFGKGLVYEEVKGFLTGRDGAFVTTRPLVVTAPTGRLKLDGSMNFATDRIDARLYVSVPVSNSLPMAALLAGAPVVAGAIFVADKLLSGMSSNLLQMQYSIKGPIAAPEITFDKPF